MKFGQQYVVRCFRAVEQGKFSIGAGQPFEPGEYVDLNGDPSRNLQHACIYEFGGNDGSDRGVLEFNFDELYIADYFECIRVNVKTVITLALAPKGKKSVKKAKAKS